MFDGEPTAGRADLQRISTAAVDLARRAGFLCYQPDAQHPGDSLGLPLFGLGN